jgi:L-alanine-DL-glutamate epimerase-like enolase superfamily enzyme
MQITGVRTTLYEFEMARAIGDANSPSGRKRSAEVAVFIDSDEGVTGVAQTSPAARPHVHALVDSLLVGRDPRGVRGLWKRMADYVFKGGNRGIMCNALSSIDIALWDLKAKANNEPLWRTLGASTRRVKAYASGIDLPLSDDELRAYYESMAQKGICGGKLKVGLDRDMDLRRLGIMQAALATSGKKPALMIDSNEYWSAKQAIRNICQIEEHFDLTWVEEPARRWDYRGLRSVSRSIRAAVATGENLNEIADFMPLVVNEGVDVVELGASCSGITGCMQIADVAHGFELPVAMMNCPGNVMAHLAAAIPNHIMMEVVGAGRQAGMSQVDNHIEDGWIVLGNAPGSGIVFDEAKLAQLAVQAPSRDGGASPWGRRPGAGLYAVGPDESTDDPWQV